MQVGGLAGEFIRNHIGNHRIVHLHIVLIDPAEIHVSPHLLGRSAVMTIILHRRHNDADVCGVDVVLVKNHRFQKTVSGTTTSRDQKFRVDAVDGAERQFRIRIHTLFCSVKTSLDRL